MLIINSVLLYLSLYMQQQLSFLDVTNTVAVRGVERTLWLGGCMVEFTWLSIFFIVTDHLLFQYPKSLFFGYLHGGRYRGWPAWLSKTFDTLDILLSPVSIIGPTMVGLREKYSKQKFMARNAFDIGFCKYSTS